jgi:hypothetical protein
MAIRRSGGWGCAVVLLVLFVPAILTAYFLQSVIWLIIIPFGTIALVMIIAMLAALSVAVFDIRPKLTPEQLADKLERHLLFCTESKDDDDTLPFAIADERLERLVWEIQAFDLRVERDKDKLRAIIAALRRGEVPEVVPLTYLTYRNR